MGGQIQSEREVKGCPYNRLADIVGEAHPAVITQAANGPGKPTVAEEYGKRSHKHKGESQFLPHVERRAHGLPHHRLTAHGQVAQRIQRGEGQRRHHEQPYPAPQVGVGGCKHLLAAQVEAQQEQTCGLAEAPRIDSPQQTGFLAKPDVGGNETGKVAGLGHFCHRGIHGVDPEVGQAVGRIDEPSHIMPPLHRLKQEEHRCHEHAAVAPVAHN